MLYMCLLIALKNINRIFRTPIPLIIFFLFFSLRHQIIFDRMWYEFIKLIEIYLYTYKHEYCLFNIKLSLQY